MEQTLRVRFAKYLHHKSNFMKVGGVAFGLPFAVGLLWMFGSHGGIGWWLFLIAAAVPAGWFWAFFMWLALESEIRKMSSDSTTQKTGEGTPQ